MGYAQKKNLARRQEVYDRTGKPMMRLKFNPNSAEGAAYIACLQALDKDVLTKEEVREMFFEEDSGIVRATVMDVPSK